MIPEYDTVLLQPDKHCAWNEFVHSHPLGTLFHTTDWLNRLADEVVVLVALDGEERIQGGVALISRSRYGVRGYHLPKFTPYYGPLVLSKTEAGRASYSSVELMKLLLSALPASRHYDFMLFGSDATLLPFIWKGFTAYLHFTFEISGSYEDYQLKLSKSRKQIIKTYRKLVSSGDLRISHNNEVDRILPLIKDTYRLRKLGFDRKVLEALLSCNELPSFWKACIVEDSSGRALAGLLYVFDQRRVYDLAIGRALICPKELSNCNYLCHDEVIRVALESNRVFDFEGSIIPGVAEYNHLLGGKPVPIYRMVKTKSLFYILLRTARQFYREYHL